MPNQGAIRLPDTELGVEQDFIGLLYRRLDQMRSETAALRDSYRRYSDNTPGGRVQRDIGYAHHNATLTALTVAEDRLCFGRLDTADGTSMHIGRLGIFDDGSEGAQLLMDWRAPSARPFYVATAAAPLGVVRRRHLQVRRRAVESLSDEYLDLTESALAPLGVRPEDVAEGQGVAGESALLSALNAPRTGRMADIVETIQAEQDHIIRSDRTGVLVVQGGPGTGKTAVALHRTAFLLYTFRDQLADRGVLIIGPNRTFLSYIGQVLPSLGENAVVLTTVGDLVPGVSATAVDEPDLAVIKGRTVMAAVVANAVLDRQRVPGTAVTIPSEQGRLRVEPSVLQQAQQRAWGSRLPHNRARAVFVRTVISALARQIAVRHRSGLAASLPFTAEDLAEVIDELRQDDAVSQALARWWPMLSPQRLIADLFASETRLAVAAPGLSPRQRDRLRRSPDAPWTVSDVPLLDEAAELLGPYDIGQLGPADDLADRREYAEDVLEMLADEHPDAEVGERAAVTAGSLITAENLSAMQDDRVLLTSTAERAAADREWTYGHVVVDEAQELSPMAWRAVMRRCPVRSMTLVGDIAQTGDPSGANSWAAALRPHVQDRFRVAELTVNYRTPTEISAIADRVLARINPTLEPPLAVRSTGVRPWWREVSAEKLARATVEAVTEELSNSAEEHLAVLVPKRLRAELSDALAQLRPDSAQADLRERAVVLTVAEAKGLEFDVVLLVEPDLIERESVRGPGDVYVALTRATQRLGVLYTGSAPKIAK